MAVELWSITVPFIHAGVPTSAASSNGEPSGREPIATIAASNGPPTSTLSDGQTSSTTSKPTTTSHSGGGHTSTLSVGESTDGKPSSTDIGSEPSSHSCGNTGEHPAEIAWFCENGLGDGNISMYKVHNIASIYICIS